MWKLAIVLCATAVFFVSTEANSTENATSTFAISHPLVAKRWGFIINQTLREVENQYAKVYQEILNLGPLNATKTMAITSKYTTKLQAHLDLIESLVDGLISRGKEHGNFDEEECRGLYLAYIDATSDSILNTTENAASQAFRQVSLEFAEMLVQVNEKLLGFGEQLLLEETKIGLHHVDKVAQMYYAGFVSRTEQILAEYDRIINGTAIEEIVRSHWDAAIDVVPTIIKQTHECVTRSSRAPSER